MTTPAVAEMLKAASDCVLYLASPLMCKKGPSCEYRHSEHARLCIRECHFWMLGTCNAGAACPFRHPPLSESERAQLASDVAVSHSRVPCYFFASGSCAKGDTCQYSHAAPPEARGTHALPSKTIENDKTGEGPMPALGSSGVKPVSPGTGGSARGAPAGRAVLRGSLMGVTGAEIQSSRLVAAGFRDLRRNGMGGGDGGEEGFDVLVTTPREEGVREEGQRRGDGGGRAAIDRQIRAGDLRNVLKRPRGEEVEVSGRRVTGLDGAFSGTSEGFPDQLRGNFPSGPSILRQTEGSVANSRRWSGEEGSHGRLLQQFLGTNGRRVGGINPTQGPILSTLPTRAVGQMRASEAAPGGRSSVAMREGNRGMGVGGGGVGGVPPRMRVQGKVGGAGDTSAPKSLSEILAERRKEVGEGHNAGMIRAMTARVQLAKVPLTKIEPTKTQAAKIQQAKIQPARIQPAKAEPAVVPLAKPMQRVVGMGGEGGVLPGGMGSNKGAVPLPPQSKDVSRIRQPVVSASRSRAGVAGFEKPKSLEDILREKRKAKDVGEEVGEVAEPMPKTRGVGERERVWDGTGGGVGMGEFREAKGEDHISNEFKRSRGEGDIVEVAKVDVAVGRIRNDRIEGASNTPVPLNNLVQQARGQGGQQDMSEVTSIAMFGVEGEGGIRKEEGLRAKEEVGEVGRKEGGNKKVEDVGGIDLERKASVGSEEYEDDLEDDDDLAKELGGFFS